MLALWGLPVPIVEAVAYHHEPEASGELRFGATAAVHVAAQLAQQAVAPTRPADRDLDHAFIERLHMREAVAGWFGGAPITAY
jgi:HD-like signal output (HDOD) protein